MTAARILAHKARGAATACPGDPPAACRLYAASLAGLLDQALGLPEVVVLAACLEWLSMGGPEPESIGRLLDGPRLRVLEGGAA